MQPFRLTSVFILTLLLGAVVAAACTNDDKASTVAETPPPEAPTRDVETIVETAVREMLEAIPTPAPAPTPDIEAIVETVLQRTTGTLLETLVAGLSVDTETTEDTQLSPEPIPVPAPHGEAVEVQALPASGSSGFLSFGGAGFGAPPIAQEITEAVGLTVTANGSVKVSADEAYVVVIPEQFYGPGGPEKLSGEDRDDVAQNLMDIGIGEDDIEFEYGQPYGPETISVEVQIGDLPEIGDRILNAIENVIRRSEHSGVRFTLSEENCDEALGLARLDAISQIDRKADDLAAALSMVRGGVIGAVEDPLSRFGYGPGSTDRCGGLFPDPYALLAFDAEQRVDVVLPLQITFAPQSDETAGLVAVASISQTVTADEAYVVVIPQRFYGPRGPEPLSMEDRADVIDKLTEIGIASDDIEIVSGRQPYEPVQISVEVAVADLPEIGERILDSVEEVLRRSENSGVRFGLSEESCNAGLAPARRDAASQADKDADGLAEAIGVVRGGVVSVAEYSLGGFNYGSTSTEACDGQFQDHNALLPFDAEPKIEVAVQIRIGYAISR